MKKIGKALIALIATMAGIFGGLKLYANRKQKGTKQSEE